MFPLLYQAHHRLHPEDLPFWLDLAAQYPDPLLELGCGTGRVLLSLARLNHRVYGIDLDAEMLAVLRANLDLDPQPGVSIFQADFAQFRLAARFGLILMPCNTFSTLPANTRQGVLQCVACHLQPGGLFAVSMPNPSLLKRLPAHAGSEVEEEFPHPVDGEPVQVSSAWRRTKQAFRIDWHYDHLLADGRVERLSVKVNHNLLSPNVYMDEMRTAGLASDTVYGDYDRSSLTPASPQLIILATR